MRRQGPWRFAWAVPLVVALFAVGLASWSRSDADPLCAGFYRSARRSGTVFTLGATPSEMGASIVRFVADADLDALARQVPAELRPDVEALRAAKPDLPGYLDLLRGGDGDGVDPAGLPPLLVAVGHLLSQVGTQCQ